MTKSRKYECPFIVWIGILLCFIFASCSNNGANDEGELFIKVVDAPASYDQMMVVVDRVSVHRTGTGVDVGWTYVSTSSSGPIDLLNLRNGKNFQLVLNKVPVGTYDKIQLNYGTCTITKDGTEHQLNLDPTIRVGQFISFGFQIIEGQRLQLSFDFDASNSVYTSGALNDYYFKPAIRVQNTILTGWITGSVTDTGRVVVSAKITTKTALDSVTTYNDTTQYGSFQLSDLPEGVYTVVVIPDNQLLMNDTLFNNVVTRQAPTNLGAIILKYKKKSS